MKDNSNKQKENIEAVSSLVCVFCSGIGITTFIDMNKVPSHTSMKPGDETWKKYEEIGACPEGCCIFN